MVFGKFLPLWFFRWCEATVIGSGIKASVWQFPVIETIHLMGLTVLLGSLVIVDLRLFGVVLRRYPVAEVAHDFMIWFWTAVVITVSSGVTLFLSEAMRMGFNSAFFVKIILIAVAITFHLTVHRKAIRPGAQENAFAAKLTACVSVLSWLSVALAGRAIAFVVGGF